jgi:ABC-type branched-subunit amino acid transport system permease subunit
MKMTIFIVGGIIGGLSGAILVGYIAVWAPSEWLYPETIILFAAVIVGGRANNMGAILGALLVPVGFEEVTRLIPGTIAGWVPPPNLIPAMQWVAIGLLIIGFLWFRPQGVRPEPRRVFEGSPEAEEVDRVRSA